MDHIQGSDRNQMFMFSLDSAISSDSFVRVVDAFVDTLDLKSFGFAHVECQEEGRPPYHPSVLLKLYCQENDITTYVSPKAPATKDTGLYPIADFTYDPDEDLYVCTQGNQMRTNGKWYHHSNSRRKGKSAFRFQRYTTPACKSCKCRHLCTKSKTNGRYIDRSEYADSIEDNAQRVNANPDYYRRRQQITEHPFGTLKRQRGFTHTNVRGKEKVLGEAGILFIGYNLTRCVSILGVAELIKALRKCYLLILTRIKWLILSPYNKLSFSGIKTVAW